MGKQKVKPSFFDFQMPDGWKRRWAIAGGILVAMIIALSMYFKPAFEKNTRLYQNDVVMVKGMSKELLDYREKYDQEPLWASRMFGGMPAYQISTRYPSNLFFQIDKIMRLDFLLPHPVGYMVLLFAGMFILLMSLRVHPLLAAIGGFAYCFSSYFFIAMEAGHNAKINALAYAPFVIAGILMTFRGRLWMGGALTAFFLALEINANHFQITYYLLFIVLFMGIAELIGGKLTLVIFSTVFLAMIDVYAFSVSPENFSGFAKVLLLLFTLAPIGYTVFEWVKLKDSSILDAVTDKARLIRKAKAAGVLVAALVIAVLPNLGRLETTNEYAKYTIRGGTVLENQYPSWATDAEQKQKLEAGLTKDYAYAWSYGVYETATLISPFYYGDASGARLPEGSQTEDIVASKFGPQAAEQVKESWPMYFGNPIFTSGPVYVGAIVCFLFIFGLIVVDNRYRSWLILATALGIMLSWGNNWQWFSDIFFDNVPMYNKFRAVSMLLVIAEITMPILAVLALQKFLRNPDGLSPKQQAMRVGAAAGATLLILVYLMVGRPGTEEKTITMEGQEITVPAYGKLGDAQRVGRFFGVDLSSPATNPQEKQMQKVVIQLVDVLPQDRELLSNQGTQRSMLYVFLAALVMIGYVMYQDKLTFLPEKGKPAALAVVLFGLIAIDMVPINQRYLNHDNFVSEADYFASYRATPADKMIMSDPDVNFRVFNVSGDPWQDARTSWFHKSVGGYHAAKLRRYNDLITWYLSREYTAMRTAYYQVAGQQQQEKAQYQQMVKAGQMSQEQANAALQQKQTQYDAFIQNAMTQTKVSRMLNVGYVWFSPNKALRFQAPGGQPLSLGDAWIVKNVQVVENPDEAIQALDKINLAETAVVEKKASDDGEGGAVKMGNFSPQFDPQATIKLVSHNNREIVYDFNAPSGKDQMVVFSEIYYNSGKGWEAFVDGKPVEHFRTNYVLRGMKVPGGKHKIEFKFNPASYSRGETLGLIFSLLALVLIGGAVYLDLKKQGYKDEEADLEESVGVDLDQK